MSVSPKVLGAFAKTHLQAVTRHDESLAARVRLTCDPEALAAIDKCSRISWLPIERHMALNRAIFSEAGAEEGREICRLAVLASFEQPFLKPLFMGALGVLGRDFGRFASWAPRAWASLFRNAGSVAWTVTTDGEGCLRLGEIAPFVLADRAYIEGLAAGFSAMLDVTGHRGDVTVSAVDTRVEFHFRWEASEKP